MELGAFSVSLTVKDIHASLAFYQNLGFEAVSPCDDPSAGWLMLRNGHVTIGLFQGMFDKNMLTFNPGWTPDGKNVEGPFTDVREIQERLEKAGVALQTKVEGAEGPGSFVVVDPDGIPILVDQHR